MSSVVRYSAHLRSPVNHNSSFWNNIYPGVDGGGVVVTVPAQPIDEVAHPVPVPKNNGTCICSPFPFQAMNQIIPLYCLNSSMVRLKSQGHVLEECVPKPKVTGDDHWERIFGTVRGPRWITARAPVNRQMISQMTRLGFHRNLILGAWSLMPQ